MIIRNPQIREMNPGPLEGRLAEGLDRLVKDRVIPRILAKEASVWPHGEGEVSNRLGWLTAPEAASPMLSEAQAFVRGLREEGFKRTLLLGMGGSSLAAEVFGRIFPTRPGFMDLDVLDSTAPESVLDCASRLDLKKTLIVVSSKSGTTAELVALFCYFYDLVKNERGESEAGSRFVAITDPGTALESLAAKCHFRRVFHGQPDVGGRFSALTAFGLLPAALKGVDLPRLLRSAAGMQKACRSSDPLQNPAALLGTLLGVAGMSSRDKLILNVSEDMGPLADWLEQLIAESTGKEGKGILPVIAKDWPYQAGSADDLIYAEIAGPGHEQAQAKGPGLTLRAAPSFRITVDDPYDLAGQFFLWEMATAVAGYYLGINPFDQPNVEETKKKTREILEAMGPDGPAAPVRPALIVDGVRVYATGEPRTPLEALENFVKDSRPGDYLAIQAFLAATPEVQRLVDAVCSRLHDKSGLPVTIGYGPRYLHSTGQLHKGDGNRGLFLQLARPASQAVPIPEMSEVRRPAPSFGALFAAQGWGDWLALRDRRRRTLRLEFERDVAEGLRRLIALFG